MKTVFTSFVIFFSICFLSAQEISKTYYFSNPNIVEKDDYCIVVFPNTMQNAVYGNPQLPYFAAELLLPPATEAYTVDFIFENQTEIYLPKQLYPKQATLPLSAESYPVFYKDEKAYASSNRYPESANSIFTTHFLKGHSIANVTFTPVAYFPNENKAYYYSSVNVIIKAKTTERAKEAFTLLKPVSKIETVVHNADISNEYLPFLSSQKNDNNYDVLIVSASQYEQDFDELRIHYLKRGLLSQFKDISTIYSEMSGVDNAEKLRNYIKQEYINHSIEYVLLGGDIEICPYRGLFCHVQSSIIYEDTNIPSDLYFSALDGNWNTNNNSLWGEIGEDDLLPELSVSRMPFSNSTELAAMLNKTLQYQINPVLNELNKPLLVGEWLYDDPLSWGADYLELLVGYRNDNGYTTNGIPVTDPYDSLYDRTATWSKYQLIARMNQGASFIYHNGHANSDYVMKMYNSDITSSNFYALNGNTHNYTIIYSHGCICGAFDYNDCIGERMVTNSNLAVAGIFNSRYGWFNEGQTEGPSAHICREFVNALYTDKYNNLGMAHKESKTATAPWVNAAGQWEEGALRWCFYDCNAFGDPALAIWRDEPYPVIIEGEKQIFDNINNYSLKVKVNGNYISGTSCVLMYDNELLGKGITDNNGICNISFNKSVEGLDKITLYVSNYNTLLNLMPINVLHLGISDVNKEELKVIPNPALTSIEIKSTNNQIITIYSISGKMQKEVNISNSNNVDISDLPSGVYIVKDGKSSCKFVKL